MTSPVKPVRLLIVDDSVLVREGIRTVLSVQGRSANVEVVGEAGTAADAVSRAREVNPDLVLMDIRLPDRSGLEACKDILRELPATRVLVLTSFSTDDLIYEAVVAGAQGYIMKEIDPPGLIKAIIDAAAGRSVLGPEIANRVLNIVRDGRNKSPGNDISVLSAQENRVLSLVATGLTNKEVGQRLGLSENTVKNYLVSVFEKLNVKRRSQAAAVYVQSTQGK